MSQTVVKPFTLLTDYDIHLFKEGDHYRLYDKLGSRVLEIDGKSGVYFAVWAPNAKKVSVEGTFNNWNADGYGLNYRWDDSGIWEGFVPDIGLGELYKYKIETYHNETLLKADPFANISEVPPNTASVVSTTWYEWNDQNWIKKERHKKNAFNQPLSIYEIHLPSWKKDEFGNVNFGKLAADLIPYLKEMNFTHVEFMPVSGYPYEPSWGYQVTGYYAVNSRLGTPQDLMYLIDQLHQNHIGVIIDWVPAHFPSDAHGLFRFDGSHLFEHEDLRLGYHPEWNTWIFNYGRNEVREFLISNAFFWIERYHVDGLRVDAVTSMLYLDYARKEGEWVANKDGGNVNLEALEFLREFNIATHKDFPDVITVAEESTSYPQLTHPVYAGGVGFDYKWMMGWMHDTLKYFSYDFLYRHEAQSKLTFGFMYYYNDKHILPLSHDEVVHGKSPMLFKMFGDEWQQHANLRALYTFMFTHPGGKLMFMGDEFGQTGEWNFRESLEWHLLQYDAHRKLKNFVSKLNQILQKEKALYELNFNPDGMEWLHADDSKNSVYVFLRKGEGGTEQLLVILNLSVQPYTKFRIAIPYESSWRLILNSNDVQYWGTGGGVKNFETVKVPHYGKEYSFDLDIPPLCGLIYKRKNKRNV